jgi:putative membrane protein
LAARFATPQSAQARYTYFTLVDLCQGEGTMRRFFMRVVVYALAIALATWLLGGLLAIRDNSWFTLGVVALVMVLVNTFIKPIVKFFSAPLTFITFGLFSVVVNACMLSLAAGLSGGRLEVNVGIIGALLGGIVIGIIVSMLERLFDLNDDLTQEKAKK